MPWTPAPVGWVSSSGSQGESALCCQLSSPDHLWAPVSIEGWLIILFIMGQQPQCSSHSAHSTWQHETQPPLFSQGWVVTQSVTTVTLPARLNFCWKVLCPNPGPQGLWYKVHSSFVSLPFHDSDMDHRQKLLGPTGLGWLSLGGWVNNFSILKMLDTSGRDCRCTHPTDKSETNTTLSWKLCLWLWSSEKKNPHVVLLGTNSGFQIYRIRP